MPSINDMIDIARPVIEERVRDAVLAERLHTLAEIRRFALRRARSTGEVAEFCRLNEEIIKAVEHE